MSTSKLGILSKEKLRNQKESENIMSNEELIEMVDRGIDKYRQKMVGNIYRPPRGNEVATKDAIRHFADGIGDPNPLWRSEDYACQSIYGSIIAPPLFLNAISEGQAMIGLPGLISTFIGAEWEWHQVIRVNDSFTVTNLLFDLEDKGGAPGQRRIVQSGLLSYLNQRGEVTGTCTWHMMRSEKKQGDSKKKSGKSGSSDKKVHCYSDDELASIFESLEHEEIRGASPRYWDDVSVGDELRPVVKGPLSISDMIAWAIGISWQRIALASGEKHRYLQKKPALSYKDPLTMVPEPIANSHFVDSAAEILMGSPVIFDLGMQRLSWLGNLVTNWMSDYGFLKKLSGRIQKFVRYGDTVWCKGCVSRKYVENGECIAELELVCENQYGEIVTPGKATVLLPSKSKAETISGA
jgi:acyl dehydratase